MRSASNLSRIWGIRIRLHYTWFVAFALITAIVFTQFPATYAHWQRILLGIATSLLLLIAVIIREFVLSFVSSRRGIPVKRVTLFVFGGVSQIAREASLPILELLLAATGLLATLIIAGIFYGVYAGLVNFGSVAIVGITQWLAFICFMLFLFQLVPGFPLDGGRLLRVLLWRVTGDYDRATRIASWTGRGIGLLCIVGGILLLIIERQWFVGLVLAGMGWALERAAAQSHRQAVIGKALESIMARDIMSRECSFVTQQLSLGQLVRDCVLLTGQRYFVVADGVSLQGVVTMRSIKGIPKKRWETTGVGEVMTPVSKLKTAHPQQTARSLLQQMDELDINQMPVLEEDKVIGIVTRDSLIRSVKTRAELRI